MTPAQIKPSTRAGMADGPRPSRWAKAAPTSAQQRRRRHLPARHPKQDCATKLDDPGQIAKPLPDTDGIECVHHHFNAQQFCPAGGSKGQGQQDTQASGEIFHGLSLQMNAVRTSPSPESKRAITSSPALTGMARTKEPVRMVWPGSKVMPN
jgi:hypothetical protein